MPRACICSLIGVAALCAGGFVLGQERPPAVAEKGVPAETPASPAVGGVEQSPLDAYYTRDPETGKLVPNIESVSFDLLDALFKKYLEEIGVVAKAGGGPQYRLDTVNVDGQAAGAAPLTTPAGSPAFRVVNLTARIELTLMSEQTTRIPLRFGDARLTELPLLKGAVDGYVEYDTDAAEHVAWIKPQGKNQKCSLTMRLRAPLEQIGEAWRFKLSAPAAAISQFSLRVPEPNLVLESGRQIDAEPADGATVFTGPVHGGLDLAWRKARSGGDAAQSVLKADSRVRIQVTGQSPMTADAHMKVLSLSGPFSGFVLTLPPGAELVTLQRTDQNRPEAQVRVREAEGNAKAPGKELEVSFPATTDEVNLRVLASFAGPVAAQRAPVELAGFAVAGARFDSGYVEMAVDREWSAEFQSRDIDPGAVPPAARAEGVTARFDYYRQPFSLRVTVQRRRTRVTVDPVYVVRVDRDRLHVEARLSYYVRGSIAERLEVQMPGWEVDAITSSVAAAIDRDLLDTQQVEPLVIPLATQVSEFQVTLSAHRELPADAPDLAFFLPRPTADTVSSAAVVVSPALNVQLTPKVEEMTALAVDLSPPQVPNLPENRQAPLYFRDRGGLEPAQFLARATVRPRSISIVDASRVDIDERRARIEQTLDYRIANEPLSSVAVRVPRMALTRENLQFSLDGEQLAWTDITDPVEAERDPTWGRVRVDLPLSRIGACRIRLSYILPVPQLSPGRPTTLSLALAAPLSEPGISVERRTALVRGAESLGVEAAGANWETDEQAALTVGEGLALIAATDGDPLSLSVTLRLAQRQNLSVVRQAWIQTWLSSAGRRDRAVYRIVPGEKQFRIRLPEGAQLDDVAVDGRRAEARTSLDGQRLIDLPAADSSRQSVVEVWYSFDVPSASRWNRTSLELPTVAGDKWVRRMYWQLAVPRHEHLWLPPAELTPELAWTFEPVLGDFGYWDRRASLGQRELEHWIGASHQAELPSGANQYLFSGFGLVPRVEFVSAGRQTMLLAASTLMLVCGLLLIYLPALRHPALLLPAGLAVAAVGVLFPEPAIQAAQAAVLGAVVALAACLLNWLTWRQRGERAVVHGTSLAGREPNTTETRVPAQADSQLSTAAAGLAVHVSEGSAPR